MTTTPVAAPGSRSEQSPWREELADIARVVLVGGAVGAFTVGVLSRLAMRLLAVLNPTVHGFISDDGFEIGQFDFSNSLSLLTFGVVLGGISGVVFLALEPVRIGPRWFRMLSLSAGAGAVIGAEVVHSDGIDFVFLEPLSLAVGLFIAIPMVHALLVDVAVAWVRSHDLLASGWWTVLGGLLSTVMLPVALLVLVGRVVAREDSTSAARILRWPGWPWLVRAGLSVVVVLAVVDLAQDINALR